MSALNDSYISVYSMCFVLKKIQESLRSPPYTDFCALHYIGDRTDLGGADRLDDLENCGSTDDEEEESEQPRAYWVFILSGFLKNKLKS